MGPCNLCINAAHGGVRKEQGARNIERDPCGWNRRRHSLKKRLGEALGQPWAIPTNLLVSPSYSASYSHMKSMLKVSLWLTGAVLFVACSSRSDRSGDLAKVRNLNVTPVISGSSSSTTQNLELTVQESIQRAVTARGYTVTKGGTADATVRAAWLIGNETTNGKTERIYTLSVSVFNAQGDRIFSARSINGWPEVLWTEARVNSEIASLFRALPEATPELAPVRLK